MADHGVEVWQQGVDDILAIEHLDASHPLTRILASVLRSRGVEARRTPVRPWYWEAEFYGLDRVEAFRSLDTAARARVLTSLSRGLLRESCFIERFGFSYTAKLMLLSRTVEEKSTFALMASDEARHLNGLLQFVDVDPGSDYSAEPLVMLLADVIRGDDPQALIFLLQALLEGYGLFHYSILMRGCNDPELAEALGRILKDEGFHHSSGVAMLDEEAMAPETIDYLERVIVELAQILQRNNGPLAALETEHRSLSRDERRRILQELGYEEGMRMRMEKTGALVLEHAPAALRERLAAVDAFRAITVDEYLDGRPESGAR